MHSTFPYQRCKNVGVQILCRHQLDNSMFNELFGCFLPQLGSAVSVWRAPYSLENSIDCLGIFSGPRLPITQLYVSQFLYCTFHLVKKIWQTGAPYPSLFGEIVRINFICFSKFPLLYVFIPPIKCLSYLFLLSFPPSTSPPLSLFP